MSEEAVLTIDVGTTALKGVVLARSGEVLADGEVTLSTSRPAEGHVEQDPESWWRALTTLCGDWVQAGVELQAVRTLILTGQMQDVVLTREAAPTRPAILYSDLRAHQEVDEVAARLGLDPAVATGNPFTAASVTPKLLWLSRHVPQGLAGRPRLHVGAKDVLIERLCGAHVTDHTTAATTGLYDLAGGAWWGDWLDALVPGVQLPELRWPHEVAGRLPAGVARRLGLPEGLPVLTGLGDAGATTLGAGVSRPGEHYLYLGTSGWVGTVRPEGVGRPEQGFRLPLLTPEDWLVVAPISNAGSVHRWAAETFTAGSFERLEALMTLAPASDLLCLPYLTGERSLAQELHTQGVFLGVDGQTNMGSLARAVLEGVAFTLRETAERLGPRLTGPHGLTLLGGGARSAAWREIISGVFGTPVQVPGQPSLLPVLGGAYPAFRFLGWSGSFADYQRSVLEGQPRTVEALVPERAAHYDRQYRRFQAVRTALQGLRWP